MTTSKTIWTIGHSTRTSEAFVDMLKSFDISQLVDVRRFPGSRKFPQFNKDVLEITLEQNGIKYFHIEALGGRRKAAVDSQNTVWKHPSFRGYADYMETPTFKEAIETLEALALNERCVIMCSEAVWWRCHRSMIADELTSRGWQVIHIMDVNKQMEHSYTKPANIENGMLTYHR